LCYGKYIQEEHTILYDIMWAFWCRPLDTQFWDRKWNMFSGKLFKLKI